MEIVVAFAKRNYRSDDMIPRSVSVIKRGISKPVRQGIDAKCRVVDENETGGASIHISSAPVTPK